ncbi:MULTISPECIES: hypothetical protein [unclassified Streptomyces]|uniref:hypothetical protein n=1 Tax=unclassified Streptomyces TaxID=2593676 RepID=UPI0036ED8FAB
MGTQTTHWTERPTLLHRPATATDSLETRMAMQQTNAYAVRVFLDHTPLPATSMVARPERVHVTLAEVDDLEPWLETLGGRITVREADESGVEMWTLRTKLPADSYSEAIHVWVHVPVVEGELVLHAIRTAVAA